jgi:hypothetical protein
MNSLARSPQHGQDVLNRRVRTTPGRAPETRAAGDTGRQSLRRPPDTQDTGPPTGPRHVHGSTARAQSVQLARVDEAPVLTCSWSTLESVPAARAQIEEPPFWDRLQRPCKVPICTTAFELVSSALLLFLRGECLVVSNIDI